MLKITYYIFRQLSLTTLFVTTILTLAVWLTQSLRFVDGVMNKGLPISTFLYLIVFILPDLINVVLPASFLGALIYTYNRLIADHELQVMRSTGMSHWQLAKPAIMLALILTTILYSLNLYFIPRSFSQLREMKMEIRNTISAAMLQEGEFHTFKGLTVYIRSRSNPKEMKGVLIYNNRDPEQPFLVTAEAGSLFETENGISLILLNGARQDIDKKTGNPSMLYFDQYTVELGSSKDASADRIRKPHEYYLHDLLNPTNEIAHPSQHARFRAHGHMRIISPLHALAFAFIGLVIMLYGEINRRRRTNKALLIVGISCLLQVSALGLLNLSERFFIAIPLTYTLFFFAIILPFLALVELFFKTTPPPLRKHKKALK